MVLMMPQQSWDKRMATGTSGYMEFVHGHGHHMRLRCATSDQWAASKGPWGIVRRILIAFWKVLSSVHCAIQQLATGGIRCMLKMNGKSHSSFQKMQLQIVNLQPTKKYIYIYIFL
jgi:hypothetical protein